MSRSINVEVFVMSKCPDAKFTENVFDQVLKSESLEVPVTVTLEYITTADGSCKHGEAECEGNKLELAVQSVAPTLTLDFLQSYNADFTQIGLVPSEYLSTCFDNVGLTSDQQKEIMEIYTLYGEELLAKSGNYAKQRGAQYSATVMIKGRQGILAVRDSHEWKDLVDGLDGSVETWVAYFNSLAA